MPQRPGECGRERGRVRLRQAGEGDPDAGRRGEAWLARQVLAEAIDLLRKIGSQGLLTAIAEGTFGVTKRPADGGRGLDGVVERADCYYNPATEMLDDAGGSGPSGSGVSPVGTVFPRASTAEVIQ